MSPHSAQRLVIVSNRLPLVAKQTGADWELEQGSGGLVTALSAVLKEQGGVWIGWPGSIGPAPYRKLFGRAPKEFGYQIVPVALDETEIAGYYHGFSNGTLWPLFHSLLGRAIFDRAHWEAYRGVNAKFARVCAEQIKRRDMIWVHDYQLLLVAEELKKIHPKLVIGFFLHIPFPSPDIFIRLPWRRELIQGMLHYDLLGFQTPKDRKNFVQCVKLLLPSAAVRYTPSLSVIQYEGQTTRIGAFPISIDFRKFNASARSPEVEKAAWIFHEKNPNRKLVLGIDRLDYTKGIPNRLKAFGRCLEKYPQLKGRISLIQIVIPSRLEVPEYQAMKRELDELVGQINGRFTEAGWVPIIYIVGSLAPVELLAHYRACEIALITPLNDGMNLVAKEYCAASGEEGGVLILSEFAGAAMELDAGAILVNPYNLEQTADAIQQAYSLDAAERKRRMTLLRREIMRHDVFSWVRTFLESARQMSVRDSDRPSG